MKNFSKMLSAATLLLAIAGAFATSAFKSDDSFAPNGYIKLNPAGTSCSTPTMCSAIFNTKVCTVGYVDNGTQLWGKDEDDHCVITLYRPQ